MKTIFINCMEEMKMSVNNNHELETKIIHWGHEPDPTTGSLASPIYQTATFAANSVEHFEELCMTWGYVYSRECNPTLTELESKLAMLDNAESAISSTSGMGAITSTLLALVKSGDHIISSYENIVVYITAQCFRSYNRYILSF